MWKKFLTLWSLGSSYEETSGMKKNNLMCSIISWICAANNVDISLYTYYKINPPKKTIIKKNPTHPLPENTQPRSKNWWTCTWFILRKPLNKSYCEEEKLCKTSFFHPPPFKNYSLSTHSWPCTKHIQKLSCHLCIFRKPKYFFASRLSHDPHHKLSILIYSPSLFAHWSPKIFFDISFLNYHCN